MHIRHRTPRVVGRNVVALLVAVLLPACAARCGPLKPMKDTDDDRARRLVELSSRDSETRASAAARLSYSKDPDEAVSRALVLALDDEREEVRRMAASALGTLDPPALGAIPALLEAMEDSDLLVVSSAAYALALLGPQARAGLQALEAHPEEVTRRYAQQALMKIEADSTRPSP